MTDLRELYFALEEKVARLSQRLELSHLVLTHIQEGIIYITKERVVSLINPAMERLLSLKKEEVLNRPFCEMFDDSLFGFSMEEALQSQNSQRVLLTLEGREVEVTASFAEGLIVLCKDRTEVARLEKNVRLNERLQLLGEMAATLAHEIRNPLGGIEGFASLLEKDLKEEKQKSMLHSIIEGTQMLNTLVSNVLDFTRTLQLHFKECDLVEIVKETASLINGTYTLESPKSVKALVDKTRLKSALLNLMRNGLEAANQIKIIVKKEKIIEIIDEGPGMGPDVLERLFTPFFTTKTKGTGLGLVEAQKVILAHGGTINIDSQVGVGTKVTLTL